MSTYLPYIPLLLYATSMVRMIAAIDSRRGLATEAGIPWNLPTDKQFFRDQVAEGLILMGGGTYHEFKRPLHGRTNYVVTSSTKLLSAGFEAVPDIDAFFSKHAGELIQDIGGAQLYATTLRYADELVLTQVEGDFGCTRFFPDYTADFVLASRSAWQTENGINFRVETWQRRAVAD